MFLWGVSRVNPLRLRVTPNSSQQSCWRGTCESRSPPSSVTLLTPVSLACKIAEELYPLHPDLMESLPILAMLTSGGGGVHYCTKWLAYLWLVQNKSKSCSVAESTKCSVNALPWYHILWGCSTGAEASLRHMNRKSC